jgi:hypothetical protein
MENFLCCPVCGSPATGAEARGFVEWRCFRCGGFRADSTSLNALEKLAIRADEFRIAATSGWIREHEDELLRLEPLEVNLRSRGPTIGERGEKLLRTISLICPLGERFAINREVEHLLTTMSELPLNPGTQFPYGNDDIELLRLPLLLMGISYSRNLLELRYLLGEFLTDAKGYLMGQHRLDFRVSPTGWAHLESAPKSDSVQAFVAMWFSNETEQLWAEAVRPGILEAGYKPFRIDKHDHNNRIDDEIIAAIRRSKFLVADFTQQRGGVYFEAGFALGLGQQVVWICKESHLKDVHFDNRQYNFLLWEDGNVKEIARKLRLRIEATIGRGSYRE